MGLRDVVIKEARPLEIVRVALDDEKQKRNEAEAKISAYAMSARELENARVSAAALESLNTSLIWLRNLNILDNA